MFNEVDGRYYIVKQVAKGALYTQCSLLEIMNANLLSGSRFAENNLLEKGLMTIGAGASLVRFRHLWLVIIEAVQASFPTRLPNVNLLKRVGHDTFSATASLNDIEPSRSTDLRI